MISITPMELLSLTALAALVAALENVFVKPTILAIWPWLNGDNEKWSVAVNLSTLLLSEVLAFIGLFALTSFTRVDVIQALLTGLMAALSAVGMYNAQSNTRKFAEKMMDK